ncbi:RNA polymerase sigma factor [Pseudobacter ginsenosidimutans]|jgi:RNA polymerase sigma-70 factor (ECF subfamily)|uniref:RNA polymerase sigma-70 factor (ECF subfamily) n=1 Tax=Pseudobacter ginsenosidimutans TaxID=661488 RepID=A0A4Q7N2T2_9BACT|nr:RNA polymerase sigma-70 factor [Pseudobacter ginsenosidimutans]QEC42946.1 RNA polymerase sigma-70 factor [Pseudobacter ginsenosidimutans]RZS74298.1 RNA polymerase sigma-70 factor (ECF subfamily) [Pseudobacter ginsenosidimutans]
MQDRSLHKEWFKLIAGGDETAFRNLFDTYWEHLYSVALMLTKSEALAEDIVQEIFLKIWNKREELPEVEKPDSYLFIIARNHIYNVLKQQQREEQYNKHIIDWFEGARENPESELLFKESSELLNKAVANLSTQQRAVYQLAREQGLSYNEVAAQLNISPNTVKNHLTIALKYIREYLRHHASPTVMIIALLETMK